MTFVVLISFYRQTLWSFSHKRVIFRRLGTAKQKNDLFNEGKLTLGVFQPSVGTSETGLAVSASREFTI